MTFDSTLMLLRASCFSKQRGKVGCKWNAFWCKFWHFVALKILIWRDCKDLKSYLSSSTALFHKCISCEYLKCLFKKKDWWMRWMLSLSLPGFSMESIPESWLLLSDESFVLKDSRSLCWLSSLKFKLQDNLFGLLLPPLDFFCPEKIMENRNLS